jgi:hypothetical protein
MSTFTPIIRGNAHIRNHEPLQLFALPKYILTILLIIYISEGAQGLTPVMRPFEEAHSVEPLQRNPTKESKLAVKRPEGAQVLASERLLSSVKGEATRYVVE